MINVNMISLGPIGTNCFIVYDEETKDAFLIDPGCDWEPLEQHIENLNVNTILLTHAHWDHIGGVKAIKERTNAIVHVHKDEADWMTDPEKNLSSARHMAPEPIIAPEADVLLDGTETLRLLGETIRVLPTPGHSPGHVSYVMGDVVFGGDALFSGSIGRTDLPGGDHNVLLHSIENQLMTLPENTTVLPGHGPPTTIGEERNSNPFLKGGSTIL